jgi:hypothetical protein
MHDFGDPQGELAESAYHRARAEKAQMRMIKARKKWAYVAWRRSVRFHKAAEADCLLAWDFYTLAVAQ